MKLLCVYCRRTDQPMVLDPDIVPMVAMCVDCSKKFAAGGTSNG